GGGVGECGGAVGLARLVPHPHAFDEDVWAAGARALPRRLGSCGRRVDVDRRRSLDRRLRRASRVEGGHSLLETLPELSRGLLRLAELEELRKADLLRRRHQRLGLARVVRGRRRRSERAGRKGRDEDGAQPRHDGSRFSRKARRPCWPSSPERSPAAIRASCSPSPDGSSTSSLAARTAAGPDRSTSPTIRAAAPTTSSATWSTSPIRSAVSEPKRSPVVK